jgi:hypothetical protein
MSIILNFDTGHNLGWSIVDTEKLKVLEYGFKKIPDKVSIKELCKQTNEYVEDIFIDFYSNTDKVIIELPEYFDSPKGRIAAKTGALLQVHASAITILNITSEWFELDKILTLTPKQWKAQLTKKATEYRVKQLIPECKSITNEHVLDSIAMGLSQNKKIWNFQR